MKTVILGGYGNFGARICRALNNDPEIEIVVAGRDADRAANFCAELGSGASYLRIDAAQGDLALSLRNIGAELVIHAAGPFQQQGYQVPLAVASAGAHYIDLADGRRFVCDFPHALNDAFRSSGRIAISGASTVPALSSAVIEHLAEGWKQIHEIDYCIAPAQTAPRGVATFAGVLNYCGAPIRVWQDGEWVTRYGWANPQRVEFARLGPRIGALCDIPDLELFPKRYRDVRSVMFRAALEIGLTQRTMSVLSTFRRAGLIKRPERLAGFLNATAKIFDCFGSALGGMVVRVTGINASDMPVQHAWHIAADHDHGPEIPCMAAILLARRLARKEISEVGAQACMGWLTLSDFEPEFSRWNMITDVIDESGHHGS
ncbi:MAG: saccharopine dehydrogenase [Burkholderiales bacterium RIFCSPLOWO2_02_FULL_57_36]|nr:MAG: saccharopine dehydrogenase [Burkholderiales bacterium RIFCSPLOWO2_02_FULL_57_36]